MKAQVVLAIMIPLLLVAILSGCITDSIGGCSFTGTWKRSDANQTVIIRGDGTGSVQNADETSYGFTWTKSSQNNLLTWTINGTMKSVTYHSLENNKILVLIIQDQPAWAYTKA